WHMMPPSGRAGGQLLRRTAPTAISPPDTRVDAGSTQYDSEPREEPRSMTDAPADRPRAIPADMPEVRVRFAPSPTGSLHIGGAQLVMYNVPFAHGQAPREGKTGTFVLRIEDTDQKRFVEGTVENLMSELRWLGLEWDEGPDVGGPYGPYVQSERKHRYAE